ncbi:excinuclease ABC subunit UvrB [bacterium]|jgi:excinuclease ABC subunit B|nr:excinuclease ABC subunit UvrB [bacterium]
MNSKASPSLFQLSSDFKPAGDQPEAIRLITESFLNGRNKKVLRGVTGSGKTFTVANIISAMNMPVLVISHNKTLAAQLFSELRNFFPANAVEYFISYYDYYQPEAYIPQTDIYIEKDSSVNEEIERLRLSATASLLSRRDVIIVASVSCIYGLGSPEDYENMVICLKAGSEALPQEVLIKKLVDIQYARNDISFAPGTFRKRGDTIEIFPSYGEDPVRVSYYDERIEAINRIEPLSGRKKDIMSDICIYPAKHFVLPEDKIQRALKLIEEELDDRLKYFYRNKKYLEAQRLESRTRYDIEMFSELGYCPGIENYSRHLTGRVEGSRPSCLIDFFPKDFLTVIDESHVTLPQVRGMYEGDRSRKKTLVEYGFRLPSALDNRPLNFREFESLSGKTLFVSATPGPYELKQDRNPVDQVIRPTGLLDPDIEIRPLETQVDDLAGEISNYAGRGHKVLVTTLTKRTAEELTLYLRKLDIRVKYIHSELDAIERVEILRDLRDGKFDVLVGINLLREGLDLPEVALVAVLDADKEGFLRSETSLIQVAGRAARNLDGKVILYADKITDSIKGAVEITRKRRKVQEEYNKKHNITPASIIRKEQAALSHRKKEAEEIVESFVKEGPVPYRTLEELYALEKEMREAAGNLDFEKAARLRDRIYSLKGGKNR